MGNLKVEPLLDQHLKPIKSGDETTPLNISTDKVTYGKEPTDNDELVNKYYADNRYGWQTSIVGGYKTNTNTTSYYFTLPTVNDSRWTDSDASISAIDADMAVTSPIFVCVKNTVITNFHFQGYTSDTGYDDPFEFFLYRSLPVDGDTTSDTTLVWQSERIVSTASGRIIAHDESINNITVDKDQRLYLFYKKATTSANQDLYFSAQLSGYYTQ